MYYSPANASQMRQPSGVTKGFEFTIYTLIEKNMKSK
jgi:hypothetical protein